MNILAEIISIGDELLAGYTINSNSAFISQQLRGIGIFVKWVTTISDKDDEILSPKVELKDQKAIVDSYKAFTDSLKTIAKRYANIEK